MYIIYIEFPSRKNQNITYWRNKENLQYPIVGFPFPVIQFLICSRTILGNRAGSIVSVHRKELDEIICLSSVIW